jgi:DNA helicase IV
LSAGVADLAEEQGYVTMLYGRLDSLREQATGRLAGLLRESGGTPQARSQRDATIGMYANRVAQYDAVENGLCFGRLDFHDGEHRHIGRIGIFDYESGDYEPLLLDWRAPAARPFYLATAASPDGVVRRRHIRTRRRAVVGLDDEVLDLDQAAGTGSTRALTGEAALLAAISASRTGRMRDIVETIQAEQDRVIRSDLDGVLVVQGGPGTGKTAVALHRAAYLLYTYRQQLSARAVLIVGPNATFLRYISQVLPALAETGVLLATLGDLYPGITARRPEPATAAEVKGRPEMVQILAAAVRDRQRVPDEPWEIRVDREVLRLDPFACKAARLRARRCGRPHNLARPVFADAVVEALVEQVTERVGLDPYWNDPLGGDDALDSPSLLGAADLADIRKDLAAQPAVRAVLDELWPVLTPEQLLADLFASADALASAAPQLRAADRDLLRRDPDGGWAPSDVPLLDEAAELLGEDDRTAQARAALLRRASLEYAQGVLDITAGSMSFELEDDPESGIASVAALMDAEALAERYARDERLSAAARAAADRKWAFGHVIVDEAQELSPMAWRLLMRRCPSRSMTVVGDLAQTGALAGPASWAQIFGPFVADRWRLAELTVSYRTPAEIMEVAARVLAGIDPSIEPPRPVRRSGVEPWDETGAAERLAELVAKEADAVGDGRLAVIAPAGRLADLVPVLTAAVPDLAVGEQPELEQRAVLLAVAQAKGLEFDGVVVVDPDGIVAESPRGPSDLYVALTRATQRLGVFRRSG